MILGQHSLRDVQALRDAEANEIAGLAKSSAALDSNVPAAFRTLWSKDFKATKNKFSAAKIMADAKIGAYGNLPNVRPDVVPAEAEYLMLARVVMPLQDLRRRLANAGASEGSFQGDPLPVGTIVEVSTHDTGPAGRLNVRSAASAQASVVGQFEHGSRVSISGPAASGFYPVTGMGVSGKTIRGFASAAYLTPIEQNPANVPPPPVNPPPFIPSAPLATPPAPVYAPVASNIFASLASKIASLPGTALRVQANALREQANMLLRMPQTMAQGAALQTQANAMYAQADRLDADAAKAPAPAPAFDFPPPLSAYVPNAPPTVDASAIPMGIPMGQTMPIGDPPLPTPVLTPASFAMRASLTNGTDDAAKKKKLLIAGGALALLAAGAFYFTQK